MITGKPERRVSPWPLLRESLNALARSGNPGTISRVRRTFRKGRLLVVATPIGNLEDVSPRALAR